ncbi:MAG: DUF2218 domain-containing protein [Acidimicrobiales bacterium]
MSANASALSSRAVVVTDDPSRYLLQLCRHFQRKIPVDFDRTRGVIEIGDGRCELTAEPGALVLAISAASASSVARFEQVITRHLARFDRHHRLRIEWQAAS